MNILRCDILVTRRDISYFSCSDHMEITDENYGVVGVYCGNLNGKEVLVGGDYFLITFRSYADVVLNKGERQLFRLLFSVAQPSKYNRNAT